MDQLEDSTLDLIYRRRVRSCHPGTVVMLMITGALMALPLVKVDVVTTTTGMIRPLEEPAGILAPISGILDSTILTGNLRVHAGDTLAWIRKDRIVAAIREYSGRIALNRVHIQDIRSILDGQKPEKTARFIQSYRNHLSALSCMKIREEFLGKAYQTATELFTAEVIPLHEFEQAETDYRLICAEINDLEQQYRDRLEEEFYRLEQENAGYRQEINLNRSLQHNYYIVAPTSGTVHNCPGLTSGSVIHSGMVLGSVSPEGRLAAECFLDPGSIQGVGKGTRVRLRFDGSVYKRHAHAEARVGHIEKDVTLKDGVPVYRVRSILDSPFIVQENGERKPVVKGMTFTASFVLFRRSIASLLLEKVTRRLHPAGPAGSAGLAGPVTRVGRQPRINPAGSIPGK
jgi:HlyD family secretion protein